MSKTIVYEMPDKKCPVCNTLMSKHLRCAYCTILVGHKHIEKRIAGQVNGKSACEDCFNLYQRKPECLIPSGEGR